MDTVRVGVIKEIVLYPVKSMGGHTVNDVLLNWHGLDGDRKYAFVQDGNTSNFPWLTARQAPKMLHYLPYFVEPANRVTSPICVKTPDGKELALESPELVEDLAAHYAGKFHLIQLGIGTFDEAPISVISTATLEGLSARVGFEVESNRFRANIIVEPTEPIDAIEDRWVGATLFFGSVDNGDNGASVAVSQRDSRCVMVNYDRQTLKQTPEVLREIALNRQSCTGVYGTTLRPGAIHVGDVVWVG